MLDWYLGLDIGTNSVGFSATDTEYNILTKGGKLQCGSRLFESAQDASTRRGFRSLRRRMARRKVRIDLLQGLFDAEIAKKDQSFFVRLNESSLHLEDKTQRERYPLFNDKGFTDREYYKMFPTIYHLRKHLLEEDVTDPRLLYLACHHLIKYRGHFLYPTFNAQRSESGYEKIIENINAELSKCDLAFDIASIDDIPVIIKDKSKSSAKQWYDIKEKLNPSGDKTLNAVFTAMQGNKISLSKIWGDLSEAEKENKDELKDFKFSSEKYDECLTVAETILNDDQLGFLVLLKSFYDLVHLDRVMSGERFICEAMVKRYNEHKSDLELLKSFIKAHLPSEYNKMFRLNTAFKDKGFVHASYVNYVGSNNTHKRKSASHFIMCVDKGKEPMTANYDDFLKYTDTLLEKASDEAKLTEEYVALKEKIENKTLCKIHNTKDNSYIPHQLNEAELRAILERQKNNFPFLQAKDCDGSVADKIVSLLTFRIPYYVGPLSEKDKGKFAWIEKNSGFEKAKVLPWNFEKVVDKAASGENFITRMTAKCTYLKSEDVIPKQSLLYQKYMVLQDLNNLKINGNRISHELKMFLYNGICQRETSLSKAKIKKELVNNGKIQQSDTVGKENENDTAFNSSLSSLIKFREILGDNINETMCENIVKWHTVFGDEKEPVRNKIKAQYGNQLEDKQIDKLCKLSFKGWAKLSKRFLSGITATDKKTGETALTIIRLLEETELNLMEILNSPNYTPFRNEEFEYSREIAKFINVNPSDNDVKFNYNSLVKELYCSPIVKRSIWQAILICKELAKINGCAPKKVFIEVTRGEDKKAKGKIKSSRREQIERLLNNALNDSANLSDFCKNELDRNNFKKEFNDMEEMKFRSDRVYFYFTQLGKCMYCKKSITLANLNTDIYDIDHIYPQSKIKDDSLTNRVLVCRTCNCGESGKNADYPIKDSVQSKMKTFWNMLKSKRLINAEKYERLICIEPLSYDRIGGFINRQLVSTNQAVKETANALKLLFGEDTKIVYSKARNVGDFRATYGLVKCREANNLHHAHDAYLNIVVGNVWDSVYGQYWNTKFTFNVNENNAIDKLFTRNRDGIWQTAYIEKIKNYLFDNKKYLDKYPVTIRPFEKKGAFYDQTIHPKEKGQYELKEGLPTDKYGGYKSGCNAYNCVIEYDGNLTKSQIKKGETPKRIRGVFAVPVRFVARYKDNSEELMKQIAIENDISDKNPILVIPKIQMFSVLEIDGIRYHMRSGDLQCSVTAEWYPDEDIIQIIHDIFKYLKMVKDGQITADKKTSDDITFAVRARNKHQQENKVIRREDNLKVFDSIIEQIKKPFYANYSFAKKVKESKIDIDKFVGLKTYEQVEILEQMLNYITMKAQTANTFLIGGTKDDKTKFTANNTISKYDIYLITQSVTGLFENRIAINVKE